LSKSCNLLLFELTELIIKPNQSYFYDIIHNVIVATTNVADVSGRYELCFYDRQTCRCRATRTDSFHQLMAVKLLRILLACWLSHSVLYNVSLLSNVLTFPCSTIGHRKGWWKHKNEKKNNYSNIVL